VAAVRADRARARAEFLEEEAAREALVEPGRLGPGELVVVAAHRAAVQAGHFTYDDPETGLKVITRLRHQLKGSCCGSACRHCVYSHQAVPPDIAARRRFNSAFWVDGEPEVEPVEEGATIGAEEGPPALPTTCCESGCANCVWLDYAEALVAHYRARGEGLPLDQLLGAVRAAVQDPAVRAFVQMELKAKFKYHKL
jgi:hypothetical protein